MQNNLLVSKIRCLSPNKKSTAKRNRNMLVYIATREGTDLIPLESELNNDLKKDIETDPDSSVYLKYIHERPKSQGLFGNLPDKEISDLTQLSSNIYQLSQTQNIYTAIISLDQRDAQALGYYSKSKWSIYLHAAMPDLGDKFKIPINDLKWVAAYHAEDTHPHVHVMFWSDTPKIQSPYIHVNKQNACREMLSKKMFEEDHQIESVYKTVSRDSLLEIGEEYIDKEIDNLAQITPGIVSGQKQLGKIPQTQLSVTAQEVIKLLATLPERGRMRYGFMPEDVKKQIDSVTDTLLENREIKEQYDTYCSHAAGISSTYSPKKAKHEQSVNKAKEDIYKRIGNKILDSVKPLVDKRDFFVNAMNNVEVPETFEIKIQLNEPDPYDEPLTVEELSFGMFINDLDFIDTTDLTDAEKEELFDLQYEIYIEENPEFLSLSMKPLIGPSIHIKWSDDYKVAINNLYSETPDYDKVLEILNDEHESGNILATYELGKICKRNLIPNATQNLATDYYEKAYLGFQSIFYEHGHDQQKEYAAYRIGKMCEYGQGIEPNKQSAKAWYKKAGSNIYAQYTLAKILMRESKENNDFSNNQEIVKLLKNSSQKNAYAAYELGRIFHDGVFANQNLELSQINYKIAFCGFSTMLEKSQANDDLMYRLGKMYQLGIGTDINPKLARELFEKSALLNNVNALYALAKIYIQSNDAELYQKAVNILEELLLENSENPLAAYALGKIYADPESAYYDIKKAVEFLKRSADLGNDFAMLKLGNLYTSPADTHPELPPDIPLAISFLSPAADLGNHYAMYSLGKLYSDPESSHYDIKKAVEFLKQSADLGNDFAMLKLGNLYSSPEDKHSGLSMNIPLGISYLEKSIDLGNHYAMYSLGKIYTNPEMEQYDIQKGIPLLKQSIDLGNSFAMMKLGNIYLWGKGIPQDIELGKYWLYQSMATGNEYAKLSLQAYDSFVLQHAVMSAFKIFSASYTGLVQDNQKNNAQKDAALKKQKKRKNQKEHEIYY